MRRGVPTARATGIVCSFCAKGRMEVEFMLAGPTVYICDECVALSADVIATERAAKAMAERALGSWAGVAIVPTEAT